MLLNFKSLKSSLRYKKKGKQRFIEDIKASGFEWIIVGYCRKSPEENDE